MLTRYDPKKGSQHLAHLANPLVSLAKAPCRPHPSEVPQEFLLLTSDSLSGRTEKDFRKAMFERSFKLYETSDLDGDGLLNEASAAPHVCRQPPLV